MALYPQQYFTFGGINDRTHTNLVKSEGMSPAEKWILDPDLPGLFEYRFGGFGYVVVPKGIVVAVSEPKYDWETEKIVNCLTIANGTNTPIGVAPYNFYEKRKDRMGDNQVSIINREYIEVPYFHNATAATQATNLQEMKWGCATSRIFNADYSDSTLASLSAGDFVKPDLRGRFVKWHTNKPMMQTFTDATGDRSNDATLYLAEPIKPGTTVTVAEEGQANAYAAASVTITSYAGGIVTVDNAAMQADNKDLTVIYTSAYSDPIEQMVGQVLAVETDLPPLGWLAYFLDLREQDNELNEAVKQAGYPPAAEGGYPAYGYKNDYVNMRKKQFDAQNPTGIPFLTDGYFRAKKSYGAVAPVAIDSIAKLGVTPWTNVAGTSIAAGVLTVPASQNDVQLYIKVKAPIAVDGDVTSTTNGRGFSGVKVYFDGAQVREGVKYHVDYKNDTIVLLLNSDDSGKTVTITCALIEDQIPGLPTEWDYSGTVGAVRILLCK